MFHAIENQRQWQLVQTNRDSLVIRDDHALARTIPLREIAGYGMDPCDPVGDYGSVDVILFTGDRLLIGSSHPHELVQVLDARLG
jgi:hypothetical protein